MVIWGSSWGRRAPFHWLGHPLLDEVRRRRRHADERRQGPAPGLSTVLEAPVPDRSFE